MSQYRQVLYRFSLRIRLIDGQADASSSTPLFKTLTTTWRFEPIQPRPADTPSTSFKSTLGQTVHQSARDHLGTIVTLDLLYEFANPVYAAISATFFDRVSKMMVQAFEDRCKLLYGQPYMR